MSNLHPVLVLILLTLSPNIVIADLFGSESYEDCILENMEGVELDLAARAVILACQTKTAAEPRSKPDYDNTCYFIFDPKTNRFNRIAATAYSDLKKNYESYRVARNGVSFDEIILTADLIVEARENDSPNLITLHILLDSLLKYILHPTEIPKEYIETQADRVPYCSR